MSGGATADGISYLLNLVANSDTAADIYYLALIVDSPPGFTINGSELDEPVATEYSRAEILNDPANWDVSDTVLTNSIETVFPVALTDWGSLNYWALCDADAELGGQVLFCGQFDLPYFIEEGQQLVLPPGSFGIDIGGNQWLMGIE